MMKFVALLASISTVAGQVVSVAEDCPAGQEADGQGSCLHCQAGRYSTEPAYHIYAMGAGIGADGKVVSIVMASGRLKGQQFSFGNNRRAELGIWARALEADATCTVNTNAGTIDTRVILAGEGTIFGFTTATGGDQGVTVTCSADIVLATGHTSETDYMVVSPEATEWYGVVSTVISLSQSGQEPLEVTESCSDATYRTYTIPGGGTGAISQNGYDSHYNGKACKWSAAEAFNVHGYGDGDGGDAVNMLSTAQGSTAFGVSTASQFLAFASLEAGSCTCSHGTVQVDTCANGVCKGKIGAAEAGATCDCTTPMWGVMECAGTNDEQLFYGDLSYGDDTVASDPCSGCVDCADTPECPVCPDTPECPVCPDTPECPVCPDTPQCPMDADGIAALQADLDTATQAVADRDESLQSLQDQLTAATQATTARDATIEQLQQAATEATQAIADRDATIANRDASIADLEAAAATNTETLAARVADIADRDATIADRDATIASLQQQIADSTSDCPEDDCPADIIENGLVNVEDLLALLAAFGRSCPTGSG